MSEGKIGKIGEVEIIQDPKIGDKIILGSTKAVEEFKKLMNLWAK